MWRLDGLRLTMKNHILPFLVKQHRLPQSHRNALRNLSLRPSARTLKGKTVKNLVTDLRACLNWAKSKKLLRENPVDDADLSQIGSTKFVKPPLELAAVDRAAQSIENKSRPRMVRRDPVYRHEKGRSEQTAMVGYQL
jgi:hypothetical protein